MVRKFACTLRGKESEMRAFIAQKKYGDRVVLENVELALEDGEILCLLGVSGAGKTTVLKILAGLTEFEGKLDGVPKRVGYLFQEPRLLPNLSVEENLAFTGGDREKIAEVLELVQLSAHAKKRPKELSGGEKQRVAIARAFLAKSDLLLLDEPFTALDTALKMRLTDLFLALAKEKKKTAVFVTHDLDEAFAVGDKIAVLKDGSIALEIAVSEERAKEKVLSVLLGE